MKSSQQSDFEELIWRAMSVKKGGFEVWGPMSTGQKIAVALILDRHDWLKKMDYTMAQAIQRIGMEWVRLLPYCEMELDRILSDEHHKPTTPGPEKGEGTAAG